MRARCALAAAAGYVPKGPRAHCKRAGHELTPENTYIDGRGRRTCKACKAQRQRDARAAKTEAKTREAA